MDIWKEKLVMGENATNKVDYSGSVSGKVGRLRKIWDFDDILPCHY